MNERSFSAAPLGVPRLMVAGVSGGSGKTIFTLGLLRLLRGRGLRLAVFKKGPDYIDAGWLGRAGGGPCTNLDPYLMDGGTILALFGHRSRGCDLAVVEGNRGLYDGVDKEGSCSSGELAKLLQAPVILVINATKMTRSAAAVALGFRLLDRDVPLAGVVLNQVAGARHRRILTQAVEEYGGLPVLGAIPRMKRDPLPMRHLGLTPLEEHRSGEEPLDLLGRVVEENCDLEAILALSQGQPPLTVPPLALGTPRDEARRLGITIGVLRDAAFQFYYPENLEALERCGARLLFMDALTQQELPPLDGLYIGGGFPETNGEALAGNPSFMAALRRAIDGGLPVYAECGGIMYLGQAVVWQGRRFPMVGAIGWEFVMEERPVGHGYSRMEVEAPNPFYPVGEVVTGHEFHYSRPIPTVPERRGQLACLVKRGHGFHQGREGITYANLFGTYTHVHAAATPAWARGVVEAAIRFRTGG